MLSVETTSKKKSLFINFCVHMWSNDGRREWKEYCTIFFLEMVRCDNVHLISFRTWLEIKRPIIVESDYRQRSLTIVKCFSVIVHNRPHTHTHIHTDYTIQSLFCFCLILLFARNVPILVLSVAHCTSPFYRKLSMLFLYSSPLMIFWSGL